MKFTTQMMMNAAAGMNAHNKTVRESTKIAEFETNDGIGNAHRLLVFLKPDGETLFTVFSSSNGTPLALSNEFHTDKFPTKYGPTFDSEIIKAYRHAGPKFPKSPFSITRTA